MDHKDIAWEAWKTALEGATSEDLKVIKAAFGASIDNMPQEQKDILRQEFDRWWKENDFHNELWSCPRRCRRQ